MEKTDETLKSYLTARVYGSGEPLEVETSEGAREGRALAQAFVQLAGISPSVRTEDFRLPPVPQGVNMGERIIEYFESRGYELIDVPYCIRDLHFQRGDQRFDVNWTPISFGGPCLVTVLDETEGGTQ